MDLAKGLYLLSIMALPLLLAITLHEAAHGWVANRFGDKTAWLLGRVTLNPIKHIDLVGTIILPIVMLFLSNFQFAFGWAKPVPVNARNLKNPRRDMMFVALAGPLTNLLMAIGWGVIAKIGLWMANGSLTDLSTLAKFCYLSGTFGITINCIFFLLNLIPIPPLDGSRVVANLLPPRLAYQYEKIEPYGIWVLLALIMFGVLGSFLTPLLVALSSLIKSLLNL